MSGDEVKFEENVEVERVGNGARARFKRKM
jgi:hypothetical protein